jgi:S-adenosylmethionine decarboxylase
MVDSFSGKSVRGAEGCALGRQMTVEFYDCYSRILADAEKMEKVFLYSARRSGATVINSQFHQFTPQGVSGVVVISESHFAVHAWPEHEYAAVDLFTCGESVDFEKAVRVISEGIGCREWIISGLVNRGIVGGNGLQKALPAAENREHREYHLSWKSRFEETQAHAISCAIDICDCRNFDFDSPDAPERFVSEFLKLSELKSEGNFTYRTAKGNEKDFIQLLTDGYLSGSLSPERRTVYLDLFVKGFTDPRKAAENAVSLLGGSYYRMQPQVRI